MAKQPPLPKHGTTRLEGNKLTIWVEIAGSGKLEQTTYVWTKLTNTPAIPGPAIQLAGIERNGRPSKRFVYVVAIEAFGPTCTCGDFEFRRSNEPPENACKHIKACLGAKLLEWHR